MSEKSEKSENLDKTPKSKENQSKEPETLPNYATAADIKTKIDKTPEKKQNSTQIKKSKTKVKLMIALIISIVIIVVIVLFARPCPTGFTGHGFSCSDFDECLDKACDEDLACSNTEGSYKCSCLDGYKGPIQNCTDIDECQSETVCPSNAICLNHLSSYTCQNCTLGFIKNGADCVDVDECDLGTHDCPLNSACHNTKGSFECRCNTGGFGVAFNSLNVKLN